MKKILSVLMMISLAFSQGACSKKRSRSARERESERTIKRLKKKVAEKAKETQHAVEDTTVTAQVIAKFKMDDDLKDADIKVETKRTLVYLTGTVSSEELRWSLREFSLAPLVGRCDVYELWFRRVQHQKQLVVLHNVHDGQRYRRYRNNKCAGEACGQWWSPRRWKQRSGRQ